MPRAIVHQLVEHEILNQDLESIVERQYELSRKVEIQIDQTCCRDVACEYEDLSEDEPQQCRLGCSLERIAALPSEFDEVERVQGGQEDLLHIKNELELREDQICFKCMCRVG